MQSLAVNSYGNYKYKEIASLPCSSVLPQPDLPISPLLTCMGCWWGPLPIPYPPNNSGHCSKHPAKAEWSWPVSPGPGNAQSLASWTWWAPSAYVAWTSGIRPSWTDTDCTTLYQSPSDCSLLLSLEYWSRCPWETSEPRTKKHTVKCVLLRVLMGKQ